MHCRFLCLVFVACLFGQPLYEPLYGQDVPARPQLQQLLDAIEQQNARISQLEDELSAGHAPHFTSAAYGSEAPKGPRSEMSERFDKLNQDLAELTEQIDEISGDKTYVHSGTSKSTLTVGGRVHLDYWGFSNTSGAIDQFAGTQAVPVDPQDRIAFRRLRFGVKGNVTDNMEYKIEMDFASPSALAMKDAYLGWNDLPVLRTLLLGNQKRPYGLDHLNSSRYNIFIERPFVVEAFNQDARRIGLCSYGVSDNQRYNWRYGVYQQHDTSKSGAFIDDNLQLELAGRFANTIWYDEVSGGRGYAHWAISGTYANPDGLGGGLNQARFRTRPEARSTNRWIDTGRIVGAKDYELLGLEGVVNVGSVQFVSEYQNVWMSREAGYGNDLSFGGGYFYVSYFLTGEHVPWTRKSGTIGRVKPFQNFWAVRTCDGDCEAGWGAWQVAARYSRGDFTDEDVFGGVGESFTFGVNWYWNANARMQFNYLTGRIDNRYATLDSGDYSIFGSRFLIDF